MVNAAYADHPGLDEVMRHPHLAKASPDLDIDPIDAKIGARVRLRRKALHISQGALAEALGVSFQQVQKYERGANRISGSTLVRAASALGTSVADLVGEGPSGDVVDDQVTALLRCSGGQALLVAAMALPADRLWALVRTAQALAPAADDGGAS